MNFYRTASHRMIYTNFLFNTEIYSIYNSKSSKKINTRTHSTTGYELHYCYSGKGEFLIGDKTYALTKNTFLLIPPNFNHSHTFESNDFRKLSMVFSLEIANTNNNDFYYVANKMAQNIKIRKVTKQICNLIDRINYIMSGKTKDTKTALMLAAISYIIDIFHIVIEKQEINIDKKYGDKRIDNAISYINENISASLSAKDVANTLNISTKQLSRLFEHYLKATPGEYIKKRKIKKIKDYLVTLDYSLTDIADFLDYNDVAALVKFFKKTQGVTPKEFRNELKNTESIH